MRESLKAKWLVPAVAMWTAAALIAPATIVDRFLPAQYDEYRRSLVQGLWLLKIALAVDGFLWLAIPRVRRLFAPATSSSGEIMPGAAEVSPPSAAEWALVAMITLLAAGLRLHHLGQGFGYDEIWLSMSVYERELPRAIGRAGAHRLFYALSAWASYQLAGPSEAAARAPAFAFGVASVPMLFLCVRKLVGRREGLVAALLLALSTFHTWYSQEATSYTMAFFFALLSTVSFYRCVWSTGLAPWRIWSVAAFFTTLSHMFLGSWLLAGQALFGLWLLLRGRVSGAAALRFVALAVYVMACVVTVTACGFPQYYKDLLISSALEARGPLADNLAFLGQWIVGTYAPLPSQVLCTAVIACGAAVLARRNAQLALYLVLPSLAVFALFVSGTLVFVTPRFCMLALIPATVFAATAVVAAADGLSAAARGGFPRGALQVGGYAMVLGPLIYASSQSLSAYYARDRYAFRPVADFLAQHVSSEKDLVLGGSGGDKFRYYAPRITVPEDYGDLREALDTGRLFWLVYNAPRYYDNLPPDLREKLSRQGSLDFHYQGHRDQLITEFEGFVWHAPRDKANAKDAATADGDTIRSAPSE